MFHTATLSRVMRAGMIDQDLPHHACGDSIKVRAIFPARLAIIDHTEIRFVNERGGLQRVVGALALQIPAREGPQLLVNQRHQLLRHAFIAFTPVDQQLGNIVSVRALRMIHFFRAPPI